MIIALASPRVAASIDAGLDKVRGLMAEAAAQGAAVICFPEAYLPGLHGVDIDVLPYDRAQQARVMQTVAQWARAYGIMTILGMEQITARGRQIAAAVFDAQGQLQGIQTKNQIAPSEDPYYIPGNTRRLFEVNGVPFGIAICHEAWRYPETVRWAAVRGAKIVFQPQHTGSNHSGSNDTVGHDRGATLTTWGSPDAPYYEKAMMLRSLENTIYFASVNYALQYPESATCVINPAGECQAFLPYGTEGVLVQEIDLSAATGLLALRYAPERYQEYSLA